MNTTKTLFAVIGMMALLATSQNAQTQIVPAGGGGGNSQPSQPPCGEAPIPSQLPISMDDIQAMAWEQVSYISVYGWTSSSINATTNDRSQVGIPYSPAAGAVDIKELLDTIKAQRLQFSALYSTDRVGLGANLCDKYGNGLFWGNSSKQISPPEDGVSKNTLDLILTMDDSILLSFPNAVGYRIVERDQNGNPIRYYYSQNYDVQNGKIRSYNYFSDKNGEMVVRLCDGTEVAYGLGNQRGQRIVPTTVLVQAGDVSVLGMRTFRDADVYVQVSPEEFSQNINPLSQLIVSGDKPRWINFAAWYTYTDPAQQKDSQNIYASAMSVWQQGQPSSSGMQYKITPPNFVAQNYLLPGRYWVKFGFENWPNDNQFYPPYQDNGYGKGAIMTPVSGGGPDQ